MKHSPPRTCITCHAERLGDPVTAKDCLGFAACETCTKPLTEHATDDSTWWLTELHKRDERKKKKQPGEE